VLGEKKGLNYKFEFIKGTPLSTKEKIDNLIKLHDKGYSVVAVLQEMGINAEQYIAQSIFEIEGMKLREKIKPPFQHIQLQVVMLAVLLKRKIRQTTIQ
jgi:hypothetical protein